MPCYHCDANGRPTHKEDFVTCPRKWEMFEKAYKPHDSAENTRIFTNSHSITTSEDLLDALTKKFRFSQLRTDHDWTYAPKKGKKVRISNDWVCMLNGMNPGMRGATGLAPV